MQNMHGQEIVEPRVRLFPEPLPVHGNANHSHSHGYAAELRIKTNVSGVGYPCLKQLALAVHSKAEAGLICRIYERELYVTPQVLMLVPYNPLSKCNVSKIMSLSSLMRQEHSRDPFSLTFGPLTECFSEYPFV